MYEGESNGFTNSKINKFIGGDKKMIKDVAETIKAYSGYIIAIVCLTLILISVVTTILDIVKMTKSEKSKATAYLRKNAITFSLESGILSYILISARTNILIGIICSITIFLMILIGIVLATNTEKVKKESKYE